MQSAQPSRQRLPNRRISTTFVLQCDGISFTVSFSLFSSGALGEIFLSSAKAGCSADNAARDSAIATSLALQAGVELETLRRGLCRNSAGQPNGALGIALDEIAAHLKDGR